jgi:hypothetical protein
VGLDVDPSANDKRSFSLVDPLSQVFAMRKDTGSMDDLHSEAAISDGNGNPHPNYKKLAKEVRQFFFLVLVYGI